MNGCKIVWINKITNVVIVSMCKHDKSLNNRGTNKLSVLTRKCFAKLAAQAGLPPRTDALIGPAAFRNVQKTDCLKRRASDAPSLFSSLLQLSGAHELVTARSNARKLTWKPARWTLATKPTIGGGLRLCQSRNGATNSTIAEESFPGDVTQPSQVSTREHNRRSPSWTRDARNKELTRENEPTSSLLYTNPSKYKLNS